MTIFRKAPAAHAAILALGTTMLAAGDAAADFVIADDLIVQGSTCTGFDCVNNENFGFDTLILKENNLRILFLDTSTQTTFPPNDWRLIANDSASGGANFFAIEDATAARQVFRVDAGAPANSLRVSSVGNVGIGTATPVLDLSINTNNTPAMRLEQNNSGGFTAQTWDVAGNEANFFIRDVTGGSRLSFRIRPGAPTSSIDISADGNVGFGTGSPNLSTGSTGIDIVSATNAEIHLHSTASGTGPNDGANVTLSNTELVINNREIGNTRFLMGNVERMTIDTNGNLGIGTNNPGRQLHTTATVRFAGLPSCTAGIVSNVNGDLACLSSTRRLKHVAGELPPGTALTNVMALRPQVGAYKETPDVPEHWLIAEDVAAVDPALVGLKDGAPYTVKIQGVVADLVAVIQAQQRRIEALERAVAR
jgi:Chaperone of endosialidase